MKNYINVLKNCSLFEGINEADLNILLNCLNAKIEHYNKNEYVFKSGDIISWVGIVLNGSVHIVKNDFWGNRTILAAIEAGDLFGEAFSFTQTQMLSDVLCPKNSDILLFNYQKITSLCSSACVFHTKLISNMMRIISIKNINLTRKIEVLTQRNTRNKLLAYLSEQARINKSNRFDIPFNRQQLADFLSVDRSAMSNELSKMQKNGIIKFRLNQFTLLNH